MKKNKEITDQVMQKEKAGLVDLTIGPNDGHARSKHKAKKIASLAKEYNSKRSAERLRRNAMLAVQYRMEHYVNDDTVTYENIYTIEDFVKDFLAALGINKTNFAGYIEMDVSNLNKYFRADRRFSIELALKFAYFFHTPVEVWLKIQIKNELLELQKEKETAEKYSKYDYEKVLQIA